MSLKLNAKEKRIYRIASIWMNASKNCPYKELGFDGIDLALRSQNSIYELCGEQIIKILEEKPHVRRAKKK